MDVIERFFHLSPDGGNGTTELALLAGALALTCQPAFRRLPRLPSLRPGRRRRPRDA